MTAIDQFAAHVGLDWADKKHDVCVQFKNGERWLPVRSGSFAGSPVPLPTI